VSPSTVRIATAAAGVPAALVVLAHLALKWNGAADFEARRTLAFQHGIALAVVLAGVLAAGRYALRLERGEGWPVADAFAIAGSIAVLAHLAAVWRDGSNPMRRLDVTVTHAVALIAVWGVTLLIRHVEGSRITSSSNAVNERPIGGE
jgi:hypothetical protein